MNYYSYKAINLDGATVRGIAEGEDIGTVYDDLLAKGLYVVDVKKTAGILSNISNIQKRFKTRTIKKRDVIEFASNLSIMLRAGVPLLSSLGDIADTATNKHFQSIIIDLKRRVEMGSGLSEAFEFHRNVFPDILIRLVKIGEETGGLDKSLSDVASHLQKMEDLADAIKRALIYPVFAILTTMGALIFWLAYVMPKVMDVMKDMGVELPLITKILLQVSNFTQAYWYLIPFLPIAIFFIMQILKQTEMTRYYVDLIKIKLPIIKLIVYNKLLAVFSEQLRILMVSGITIDRSFDIISDVMGNEVFRKAILSSKDSISAGNGIADALRKHEVFPPLLTRMVSVGESSGNLDEQFAFLSDYYLKKLDDISEKIGKMVEPIVIVVIGILFAIILVGLLFPIYDLIIHMGM